MELIKKNLFQKNDTLDKANHQRGKKEDKIS